MSQESSQSRREPTFDNDIGTPAPPEPVFTELADSIAQAQVDQIQLDAGAAALAALQAKDDEIAALNTQITGLQEQLTALNAKAAELGDQYLRGQAEVQNARRRADDEVAKARKFALEGFAEHLLPVVDSLEAGLAIQEATAEQVREGAEATLRQLQAALERNKVVAINPEAGAKFDPHQHQAISVVPVPEGSTQGPNTIVGVLQKGYLIAERVLRPALVTVSAP